MKRLALLSVLVMGLAMFGCTDFSSKAGNVASVASQASGAVQGLIDVALAAPLDDATKDQIAVYGRWAKLATDAAVGVSSALSATDAVEQATGTVQAINKTIQAAPIPETTKATAGGWADWALIALRAAATILPMVL